MNFNYKKLSQPMAQMLRAQFIDKFINKNHPLYNNIDGISADKDVQDGYTHSHLWSCLKIKQTAEFYSMMRELGKMNCPTVYAMWDVYPKNSFNKGYVPEYLQFFRTDDIIELTPKELCEMLLREHHIEERASVIGDICTRYLPEDLYIFDYSLSWFMALTHEEIYTNNTRLCYSNK